MKVLLLLALLPLLFTGAAVEDNQRFKVTVVGLTLTGDSGHLAADGLGGEVVGSAKVILPPRADRTLIRHPGGAVVSPEEVAITAERITIQDGLLLKARGRVVIATRGEVVEASEFDLFLKIGDGEAKGNVRVNGEVPSRPDSRDWKRRMMFPPDIWERPATRKK